MKNVNSVASTNYERVSKAIELLAEGLAPFVDRVCRAASGDNWLVAVQRTDRGGPSHKVNPEDPWFLLNVMLDKWHPIFSRRLAVSRARRVSSVENRSL